MPALPMYFFPDEPVCDEDLLGFGDFADLIYGAIGRTQTPFVYGVLGDWGTGKTSTLQMLQACYVNDLAQPRTDLDTGFVHVPIWFNAWKYENETNVLYPLLHAIKQSYNERLTVSATRDTEFAEKFRHVAQVSTLVLSDILLRTTTRYVFGEALKLSDITGAEETIRKDEADAALAAQTILSKWTNQVDELERAFTALLEQYAAELAEKLTVTPKQIRFVIFIDDLDRCLPDTTLRLLESIKNYLTVNSPAIFVLGLNPRVVYQGIRHKFGGIDISGREYLEKMLNFTFYMPQPEAQYIKLFAASSLARLTKDFPEWDVHGESFQEFGQILNSSRFTNPRRIKRILNRFLVFISKYSDGRPSLNEFNLANVIRLLIIAEYYPAIFQIMLNGTYDPLNSKSTTEIGSNDFRIETFESDYGVQISGIYPQLAENKDLFAGLRRPRTMDEPDFAQHVSAIYSISRIV